MRPPDGSEQDMRSGMRGEEMRALRQSLRLSQAELKEDLNRRLGRSYDKPKISRWENGRDPIPEDVAIELGRMTTGRAREARVIALANQKGGVGKTTSALNLAYALAIRGCRALLVDLDPQATATVALLAGGAVDAYRQGRTMAHVILHGRSLRETIFVAGTEVGAERRLPFGLAPSHIDLAEVDSKREPGFDAALREKLDEIRGDHDYVVIDAPPNLGMLTWMALTAAQDVIIPVRTEPYDTMGVGLILGTVNKVQRRLNPGLRLGGILPTQYSRRKAVDREVLGHLVAAMGDRGMVLRRSISSLAPDIRASALRARSSASSRPWRSARIIACAAARSVGRDVGLVPHGLDASTSWAILEVERRMNKNIISRPAPVARFAVASANQFLRADSRADQPRSSPHHRPATAR